MKSFRTSVLKAGLYCLWSSMIIFKQTKTFSSFSSSNSFSIRDNIGFTYGLNKSLVGKRCSISNINFLTCWILYSAMKWGSPSWSIFKNIFTEWSKKLAYKAEDIIIWNSYQKLLRIKRIILRPLTSKFSLISWVALSLRSSLQLGSASMVT